MILEIRAGYGGFCNLITKKINNIKYIIVDIQPSISFSSYFLYKLGKKIILPHEFEDFEKFLNSDNDILFLYPDQIDFIPNNSIDIIVNMDSMVEMGRTSIDFYQNQTNRILKHYLFSNNPTNHLYTYFIKRFKKLSGFNHLQEKSLCVEECSHLAFEMTMSNNCYNDIFIKTNC